MKSRADQITELVVGKSLTINLGVPVEPVAAGGIRIGTLDLPAPSAVGAALKQRLQGAPKWALNGIAVLTVLAGSFAFFSSWGGKTRDVPVEAAMPARLEEPSPVRLNPSAIQVVAEPYSPADPALPIAPAQAIATQPVAAPPSVLAAARAEGPQQGATPAPQIASKVVQAPPLPPPGGSKVPDKVEPRPAVLVDEAPAAAPASKLGSAPAVQPAPVPAASKPVAMANPSPIPMNAASKPVATLIRGTGLVAITPDGKSALFTNPKSRMPEQFKVGDSLPSGEVVKFIDLKEGRVSTNAKEYVLE